MRVRTSRWTRWGRRSPCLRKRWVVGALVLSVALVGTGCGGEEDSNGQQTTANEGETDANAEAETVVLRYATPHPEGSLQDDEARQWGDRVEELSDGLVEIEHHNAASLVEPLDALAALQDGRIEMGFVGSPYWQAQLPVFSLGSVPLLADNPRAHTRAWYELMQENQTVKDEFTNNGIRYLVIWTQGPTATLSNQELNSVDDLDGLRMRVVGEAAQVLEQFGLEPVAQSPAEVYESVQRGVLDGVGAWPFEAVPSFGFHEVVSHATQLGIGQYGTTGLGIGEDVWESLPSQAQEALLQASDEFMSDPGLELLRKHEDAACEAFSEEDVTVSVWPEQEQARLASDGMVDKLVQDWMERASAESDNSRADLEEVYEAYTTLYEKHAEELAEYESGLARCADGSSS